jgi:hypothetical protein
MKRYQPLSDAAYQQLGHIEPIVNHGIIFYPCSVQTTTGQLVSCVYITEETGYFRRWGVWPEDDKGKHAIHVNEISSIAESPCRLPARYANELYKAGETGMGYQIFTVRFKTNIDQTYLAGGVLDFINYPKGLREDDILQVSAGQSGHPPYLRIPTYYWCLYSE